MAIKIYYWSVKEVTTFSFIFGQKYFLRKNSSEASDDFVIDNNEFDVCFVII